MINQEFNSAIDIIKAFPNEEICIAHLAELRWNGNIVSPFDPFSKVYACSNNRYRCRNSRKYFNAKTGTIFHNSKVELQKWFIAIWIVNQNQQISSVELAQDLKITQKTAWYMLRRIRKYAEETFDFDLRKKPSKSETTKMIEEMAVNAENDKLQMHEWLKLFKK